MCPRDATELEAAPEDDDPLLGTVVGESYEIVRVIGEGGMGRVYEARHVRLPGKRFAVKVLHADLARQPEVVSRFLQEAQATSVLAHANIVAVVDVNRAPDGRPFIVAELLEGEQLADYLDRVKTLSIPEAVSICRQVCAALAAAHERDIVHRDIKPENVFLVGPSGKRTVKVLDFGISRLGDGAANLTKTGMVMGTPAYMPPEQARGARVDHRADIYAVGAILYEAVTGRRPFDGPDLMATLSAVLSEEPARPCTLNASLPPALEMTIQRAMAKQPNERHRTMLELDAELATFDQSPGSPLGAAHPDEIPTTPVATVLASAVSLDPGAAARRARMHIVVLSLVAAGWAFFGLMDALTSSIRWARDSAPLSPTEFVLTSIGALALLIAPSIAWVRYVRQRVWPSTPRAVELVAAMRGVLVAAFVTYAAGSFFVRVVEGVLRDDPRALSWPGWSVLMFVAANIAAAATWAVEWARARRTRAE
ncbi:MAG TPA: serine/threonine-protein kinase [Polyangiales bacterium]|nr:serine/threonine-protein kinase [Polyangiales bacterium]